MIFVGLRDALNRNNTPVVVLDSSSVTSALGRYAFSKLAKLRLLSWLTEQEESAFVVLYVADTSHNDPWTTMCIRQVIKFGFSLQNRPIARCLSL